MTARDGSTDTGRGMATISSEEYLRALDDADLEDECVNEEEPDAGADEASEAERLAGAAEPPGERAGLRIQTPEGWRRVRRLTPAQEAFARGVIEGKSYRQAYRDAYPGAQGQPGSIASSAYKLSRDPRIQALIQAGDDEHQDAVAEDLAATKRYVMRRLVEMSKAGRQEGSRLKALELLGRAAGMWRDVQQAAEEKPLTAAELKAALAGHLRLVQGRKA